MLTASRIITNGLCRVPSKWGGESGAAMTTGITPRGGGVEGGVLAPGAASFERQGVQREVALLLARYEIRNLRRWFDDFDRDILLPILLGEIALHNIGAYENGAGTRKTLDDPDDLCPLKPCNAYSIAAATGLPRETVRRKIVRLIELGWIRKRHNGHLYVTAEAINHFGSILGTRQLSELLTTADRARRLIDK